MIRPRQSRRQVEFQSGCTGFSVNYSKRPAMIYCSTLFNFHLAIHPFVFSYARPPLGVVSWPPTLLQQRPEGFFVLFLSASGSSIPFADELTKKVQNSITPITPGPVNSERVSAALLIYRCSSLLSITQLRPLFIQNTLPDRFAAIDILSRAFSSDKGRRG